MRSSFLRPGFMVVHGNRPAALRDLLVQWIQRHPLAPLENEIVLVQSNGIAQWLKLALAEDREAGGCGIAAAIDAQLPSRFLWQVYRAVLGEQRVPRVSPFDKALLIWRLMRLLPALLSQPAFVPLRRFLARDADMRKRYQLAERLADLLDQYQVYRADWLTAWASGRDDILTSRSGWQPIAATLAWQPILWRALLDDVARDDLADGMDGIDGIDGGLAGNPTDPTMAGAARAQTSRADVHRQFLAAADALRVRLNTLYGLPPETGVGADKAEGAEDTEDAADDEAADDFPPARQAAIDATRPVGLPRRLLVFGISSLPQQALEVLSAIAPWTQVLLCVHNPCQYFWADIIADKDLLRAARVRHARKGGMPAGLDDAQLHLHVHPLLAAWGKQGRDFIGLLDRHDETYRYRRRFVEIAQRIDLFESEGDTTLLQQLQDDILCLRPVQETRARWPAVDPAYDTSLLFHCTHSAQREVEVLHDRLLAAFAADPTLQPRDVIVMVPDIDTYAPHVQAVFGLPDQRDPRHIRYQLADQGARRQDPLLGAVDMLLGLPQARLAVSDVLDLLDVPALRARFGIAERDLPLLHRWITQANIRWGLDALQRERFVPSMSAEQNSWLFGLRRMLLGYAVGDGDAWHGIEPLDEIGGLDAVLLGPLTRLLDALHFYWKALSTPALPVAWGDRLRALLDAFFDAEAAALENARDGIDAELGNGSEGSDGGRFSADAGTANDGFTLLRLDNALASWLDACAQARLDEALPLSVVREHWLAQMEQSSLAQPFFAGAVTFATLMPMRAIPFRIVCLLGMNDGDYPRHRIPMDFDLMAGDYRPGDRSRREDDRYLFLEAVLSARDHLHISWVGSSIHDNTERPPSVLVAQLRDHIASGWRLVSTGEDRDADDVDFDEDPDVETYIETADDAGVDMATDRTALLDALTVTHRMQPFSRDYFTADRDPRLFSYAHEWRDGLAALDANPQKTLLSSTDAVLPAIEWDGDLTLKMLSDFLSDPTRAFFQTRLKVSFREDDPVSDDQEPFVLEGLDVWSLQDELIRRRFAVERLLASNVPAADASAAAGFAAAADAALDGQLRRMARRGALPVGAFGGAAKKALSEPLVPLFEAYDRLRASWPDVVPPMPVDTTLAHADGMARRVVDSLVDLRGNEAGDVARVLISSSALIDGNSAYRRDKWIPYWIAHLGAHAMGQSLTTEVISKKGDLRLPPVPLDLAEQWWDTLIAAWEEGMRQPLPLAVRTGFAWLEGGGAHGGSRAIERARKTYEGDGDSAMSERDKSPYLARAFPTFDVLWAAGAEHWIVRLLGPLHETGPRRKARGDSGGGSGGSSGANTDRTGKPQGSEA